MTLEIGSIVEGKVSGIMPFGAFITLPENKVGLVHISEVSSNYVSDINEHLKVGDVVKAKVMKLDERGKISLSIKKAMEKNKPKRSDQPQKPSAPIRPADIDWGAKNNEAMSFEDKLKQFMQDSDSKISGIKQYSDRRVNTRRAKR